MSVANNMQVSEAGRGGGWGGGRGGLEGSLPGSCTARGLSGMPELPSCHIYMLACLCSSMVQVNIVTFYHALVRHFVLRISSFLKC